MGAKIARMGSLDLAADLSFLGAFFQRDKLRFRVDQPFGRRVRFQCLEALPERAQLVSQPSAADTRRRNENAALAQLVTRPDLGMGRLFHRMFDYHLLDRRIDPVLQVRCPEVPLERGVNTIRLYGLLVAIEHIPRYAHDLAGPAYVVAPRRQVQKPDLVLNDILCTMQHEGNVLMVLIEGTSTSIRNGNPHFFKRGVRTSRNFYT